jgi:hypothetical protein
MFILEFFESWLMRFPDVAPVVFAYKLDVVLTDHSSVDHPHARGDIVTGFYRHEDTYRLRHISPVVGE